MKTTRLLPLLALAAVLRIPASDAPKPAATDWPVYGGDAAGNRHSTLSQINATNVAKLSVAWTFDTGEGRGDSQTQPLVIGGVLYGITPKHRIFALDAATGRRLWTFDSGQAGHGPNRGLTYWADGADRRIFVGVQSALYSLDAATGKPVPSFGNGGCIDLREGLGRDPKTVSIVLTSPGVIYKDLIITGGRMPEALPSAPGDIRAFDVRTGKPRWAFHTVPRPGEPGYETWPKDAYTYTGSANNWPGMAVDEKAGIVYAPTGSAASDFFGFDRQGDNLYANTLLALDAATGKRIWHFQAVHHDIWDRDFPSQPTLVTVRHDGHDINAVAQTTKAGTIFLFNRTTGEPLFPVRPKTFPQTDVPGEASAPTQPFITTPEPFARQLLTADILTTRTPAAHEWAVHHFQNVRSQGQFVPLSVGKDTVIFPGFDGGAEWGGSAYDPATHVLYVNANDIPWTSSLAVNTPGNSGKQSYLRNCAVCHGDTRAGAPPQIPSLVKVSERKSEVEITKIIRDGAGRMPAFTALSDEEVAAISGFISTGEDKELGPAATPAMFPKYRFSGYKKFLDPDGYPAVQPPWGTLNAINLDTGKYLWKIPLGEYPELAANGMANTGTENYGGPLVTDGGLVFIAATNFDRKLHAFDKQTGKLLWQTTLPASGNATPVTYSINGKQYVVAYATGGKARPSETAGGIYQAYALSN